MRHRTASCSLPRFRISPVSPLPGQDHPCSVLLVHVRVFILSYIVGLLTRVLASVLGHFVSSQYRASTSHLLLYGSRRQ